MHSGLAHAQPILLICFSIDLQHRACVCQYAYQAADYCIVCYPGRGAGWPPGWNAGVFDIHAFVVRIRLRAGRAASARVGVSELSLPAMTCSGESFGGRRRGAWWAVLVGFVV